MLPPTHFKLGSHRTQGCNCGLTGLPALPLPSSLRQGRVFCPWYLSAWHMALTASTPEHRPTRHCHSVLRIILYHLLSTYLISAEQGAVGKYGGHHSQKGRVGTRAQPDAVDAGNRASGPPPFSRRSAGNRRRVFGARVARGQWIDSPGHRLMVGVKK